MDKTATNPLNSELFLYIKTSIFSLLLYLSLISYQLITSTRSPVNKSLADTGIILIGFSMGLSGICYFWNLFDRFGIYRKHLGMVGYAYALLHLLLSWDALTQIWNPQWSDTFPTAPVAGLIATLIFTFMAIISNTFAVKHLGGKLWRRLQRTGYLAIVFVWLHVVVLRFPSWSKWVSDGFPSWPTTSLITAIFMLLVLILRLALALSLFYHRHHSKPSSPTPNSSNTNLPTHSHH